MSQAKGSSGKGVAAGLWSSNSAWTCPHGDHAGSSLCQPDISPVAFAAASVEGASVGAGCLARASSMSRDRVKGVESWWVPSGESQPPCSTHWGDTTPRPVQQACLSMASTLWSGPSLVKTGFQEATLYTTAGLFRPLSAIGIAAQYTPYGHNFSVRWHCAAESQV